MKLCLRFKFLRLLRSNGSRDTGTQHTASLLKLLKTFQRSRATTDADSTSRPKPRPLTLNVPLPPPLTHSLPVVIETQKAPWLPPARQRRVHHCRRQPHATQPHLLYRQRFPPERRLRNVWCTRTPRGAPACRVRSCAGSRGWISASSLGTSSGAEASQAPREGPQVSASPGSPAVLQLSLALAPNGNALPACSLTPQGIHITKGCSRKTRNIFCIDFIPLIITLLTLTYADVECFADNYKSQGLFVLIRRISLHSFRNSVWFECYLRFKKPLITGNYTECNWSLL